MREQIWLKKSQKYGELCYMTKDMLEETLALRNYVRSQMENRRWFAPAGREDFEAVLKDGFGLVCFADDGKMIASLQCLLENVEYAHDLYKNEDMVKKCADYSDVFVHPDYRGNGLQNFMEKRMEALCLKEGKTILLGTVDPENSYSYNNFIKANYHPAIRLKKYGGLERLLMKKVLGTAEIQKPGGRGGKNIPGCCH